MARAQVLDELEWEEVLKRRPVDKPADAFADIDFGEDEQPGRSVAAQKAKEPVAP